VTGEDLVFTIWQVGRVEPNGTNVFLISVVFTPSHPHPPRQCLAPVIYLLLTKHCIAGARFPIHMIGEVSWEQKEDGPRSINFSMANDRKNSVVFINFLVHPT
jgi:hypothetical protein